MRPSRRSALSAIFTSWAPGGRSVEERAAVVERGSARAETALAEEENSPRRRSATGEGPTRESTSEPAQLPAPDQLARERPSAVGGSDRAASPWPAPVEDERLALERVSPAVVVFDEEMAESTASLDDADRRAIRPSSGRSRGTARGASSRASTERPDRGVAPGWLRDLLDDVNARALGPASTRARGRATWARRRARRRRRAPRPRLREPRAHANPPGGR